MNRQTKHKVKEVTVDGWGKAWELTLGYADEDGYQWQYQNTYMEDVEATAVIKAWHADPALFSLIQSAERVI